MDKRDFLQGVAATLAEHPEWMAETIQAIHLGVQQRLSEEIRLRSNAEVSLMMCYDKAKARLRPHEREKVERALVASGFFQGTPFASKLQERVERKAEADQ